MQTSSGAHVEGADAKGPSGETATDPRPVLLVVDDIADNRDILSRRFRRRGFEAVEADGGQSALDAIAHREFDLVLLDIMMPDIDGIEVLKCIRENHSQTSLPVIMLTARDQGADMVEALELGANDYIVKPVDFAVALARVNAQVERRRTEGRHRTATSDLEAQVAARTAHLKEANERLQAQIAEQLEKEETIRFLAYHDPLTELGNRILFRERLEGALSESLAASTSDLAVVFFDLDGFKAVNDTLGHEGGDALLRQVADRLRTELDEDLFVARLGGDEFALLQRAEPQPSSAEALATRVCEILSQPFLVEDQHVVIGASCGVAIASAEVEDVAQILKMADLAMYAAKGGGKNCYRMFRPSMLVAGQARRELELALRRGLQQHDFELHFQPVIDLVEENISTFEALLRWPQPDGSEIAPETFIPVAEETGIIVPLGEWALREACAQAARWPLPIRVAVNVSPAQFKSESLLKSVGSALQDAGLDPSRLELEITETVLLETTARNLEVLHGLRDLGVRISMDDFGTGYSSMGYLQAFAFDKIKIDRSFIAALHERGNSLAIVQAIAGLSTRIGITTTAEGVETPEQLEALRLEGCTEIQGYIFSRPIPAGEVATFISGFNRALLRGDGAG